MCVTGASVSGYDDPAGDNSSANAADSPAASPEPSTAPNPLAAATGPDVTAGTHTHAHKQEAYC